MMELLVKRVFGFALFFVAIGMVVELLIPDIFVEILLIFLFLLLGYNLFYC